MRLNSAVKVIRPEMMLETNGQARSSSISSALSCFFAINAPFRPDDGEYY